MKRVFIILLMLFLVGDYCYGQGVGKVEKIELLGEEMDEDWGFVVKKSKRVGRRDGKEFREIIEGGVEQWCDDLICFYNFLPDVCVRCERCDVYIEFDTGDVVFRWKDGEVYDYMFTDEGYERRVEWCWKVIPGYGEERNNDSRKN